MNTLIHAEHWMSQAFELACRAEQFDEVPVGALLVSDQEILGTGSNCRQSSGRTSAHAEMMALEDFNLKTREWRVPPGSTLFVTIEPCLMCTGALLWAQVDHVCFGCSDPKNAGIRRVFPLIAHGVYDHKFLTIQGGVLAERCATLISKYFKKKRQELPTETTKIVT